VATKWDALVQAFKSKFRELVSIGQEEDSEIDITDSAHQAAYRDSLVHLIRTKDTRAVMTRQAKDSFRSSSSVLEYSLQEIADVILTRVGDQVMKDRQVATQMAREMQWREHADNTLSEVISKVYLVSEPLCEYSSGVSRHPSCQES
jgi:hypothetical protein